MELGQYCMYIVHNTYYSPLLYHIILIILYEINLILKIKFGCDSLGAIGKGGG